MDVRRIEIEAYRSIRKLSLPVERLNVFVGENGVGKTNLYRAIELLQAAALGTLARELAAEGGMQSALWSGKRGTGPARLALSVSLGARRDDYRYRVEAGLVQSVPRAEESSGYNYRVEAGVVQQAGGVPIGAGFPLEPHMKEERLTFQGSKRPEVYSTAKDRTPRPVMKKACATISKRNS